MSLFRKPKMNLRLAVPAVLAATSVVGATPVLGATPEQCARIADDARRLACYDAVFRPHDTPVTAEDVAGTAEDVAGTAEDVANPTDVPSVPVPSQPAAAPAPSEAPTGLGAEDVRAREPRSDQQPQPVRAHIAAIEVRAYGRLVFELDNGQAWQQIEADGRYFRVGAEVTVERAGLSGYRLIAENGVSTRVSRVR